MHVRPPHARVDLVEDLDAFIWEADPVTFQFTFVSQGAERLLGYSLEDWLSRPTFWVDLLHPDDRQHAVTHCKGAIERGEDHDFQYRAIAADGRVVWIRDVVKVIPQTPDHPALLRGVMADITDQKLSVSALDKQARYFRTLIEQVSDVLTVVDHGGNVCYQSPSTERVLGYPGGERIGQSMFDHVHADDVARVRSVFEFALVSGRHVPPTQFRYRHADGTWKVLEAVGHAFVEDEGLPPLGIISCRDITDRTRLEEMFRHAQKMEAVGRLTATLSHDFNNVLQTVLGNAELALNSEHGTGVHFELTEIRKAAEMGMTLTRQLLAFSRRSSAQPERVDVNLAISNLAGMLRRLVGDRIHVDLALHATKPWVRMGRGMLDQVLMNLASNARDAMPAQGQLRISTSTAFDHAGESPVADQFFKAVVVIEVSDTGVGLTDEARSRLFEPYFTTKDEGKGTGLGLPIIYNIVRECGGQIEVFSAPGTGTTFSIYLPIDPAAVQE